MGDSNRLESSNKLENCPQFSRAPWRLWIHRYRTRKHLHDLLFNNPEHLKQDLGMSTKVALEEINKPFWRD